MPTRKTEDKKSARKHRKAKSLAKKAGMVASGRNTLRAQAGYNPPRKDMLVKELRHGTSTNIDPLLSSRP